MKKELNNRDLSWIDFNYRVLAQTKLSKNPLGEKFNFLQITQSNLDEYIMVRYAKALHNDKYLSKQIEREIKLFVENQDKVCAKLIHDIKLKHHVSIENNIGALNESERNQLLETYKYDIQPHLKRYNKRLISKHLYAMLILNNDFNDPVIIDLEDVPRYVCVRSVSKAKYIRIEDVIGYYDYRITKINLFRVCTDAYFELGDIDDNNLYFEMENIISKRDVSRPIYLEIGEDADEYLIKTHIFARDDIFVVKRKYIGIEKINVLSQYLTKFESIANNKNKVKKKNNIFKVLDTQDILLQHPFDSYDTIVRLLEDAADYKKVTHIYQTLYRVSGTESPIVEALCKAARKGIKVTVLVEVKARFSEGTNLDVIDKLKDNGVKVLLPPSKIKVHAKAMLIMTKEKYYCHIGTGNYNEKTAKIYTDVSLLTSNEDVGIDLYNLFKMLADKKYDKKFRTISSKPGLIREKLMKELEKLYNKEGAEVTIKCNSLCDPKMCEAIIKATKKGVKFNIICRGACSLNASKHIKISSIIGRYLEHGRIYRFKTANSDRIYISSADLLSRNLDRRIEILYRVNDEVSKEKLRLILKAYKKDDMNKFVLKDGEWYPMKGAKSAYNQFVKDEFNERISKVKANKNQQNKFERMAEKIHRQGYSNGYGLPF